MKKKTINNNQGMFLYTRDDKSAEFFCERCEQNKKSKIVVKWINDNVTKTICNGCYGYLIKDK